MMITPKEIKDFLDEFKMEQENVEQFQRLVNNLRNRNRNHFNSNVQNRNTTNTTCSDTDENMNNNTNSNNRNNYTRNNNNTEQTNGADEQEKTNTRCRLYGIFLAAIGDKFHEKYTNKNEN